ncbi:GntR family transcriptional regulator [Methylopila turkensis]|uniref:GntR family transcriptional regulator n=1 Tax=Methylopila turkensis TaxID=1437816 RepID=A0A9W6JS85_9HYPH|nr:GntR family transcriptional regulator [Methylopila turkensis]GLK81483.1 GntR family transcriptional regulator [Methylopila turkensis]
MSASSRADLTYQSLRRAIIEQAVKPGAKLREDEIGGHFGVSRTIVRAALARLHAEGLVDIRPKRTATVAAPTADEARAIFEVRRCLEREVVAILARCWSASAKAALLAHIEDEDTAGRRGDHAGAGRLAGEFHIVLARLTGNALLERYVSEVVSRSSLILAVHGRAHRADCSTAEHRGVVAALDAGDEERAMRLMAEHLQAVIGRALPDQASQDEPSLTAVLARYGAP